MLAPSRVSQAIMEQRPDSIHPCASGGAEPEPVGSDSVRTDSVQWLEKPLNHPGGPEP